MEDKEQRARDAQAQQMNRAHLLGKELEEAQHEIKSLTDKIKALEDEIADLRNRRLDRGSKGDSTKSRGSTSTTTTTTITKVIGGGGDKPEGDEIEIPCKFPY